MRPLKLITLDIDDTLYSSTGFAKLARANAVKAMIACGLDVPFETAISELNEVVAEFSSNDGKQFDRLLLRLPAKCLNEINPAVLVAAGVGAYHDTKVNSLAVYEDALEVARRLCARGYSLGVATQGQTVKQAEKLIRLKVLPCLKKNALFFSDQVGSSKANSKFYTRAAELFGVSPKYCMHIGDRPDRDITPANAAGWLTVLNQRSGKYIAGPDDTPPTHIIRNFWDLDDILEQEYRPA